jgi:hypothetical protein
MTIEGTFRPKLFAEPFRPKLFAGMKFIIIGAPRYRARAAQFLKGQLLCRFVRLQPVGQLTLAIRAIQ